MNSALNKLKSSLPLEEVNQKLSKKDILTTATLYIKLLSTVLRESAAPLHSKQSRTLNLNDRDYLYR